MRVRCGASGYTWILALSILTWSNAVSLNGQSIGFVDSLFPIQVTIDLVYAAPRVASEAALQLDLYEPTGPGAPQLRPAFVAIHGGGLARGDKTDANIVELCRALASRGYSCAAINYRVRQRTGRGLQPSPTRALQDAVDDAGRAIAWITTQASAWRIDPRRIAVGGSSAGAAIALRVAYGPTPSLGTIGAVLSWSGSLYASGDLIDATDPPLFIVHGAADTLVGVEEARSLARRARAISLPHAVYICEGVGHNMPLDRRPLGQSLYRHLAAFLAKSLDLTQRGPGASSLDGTAPTVHTDPESILCPH
jgi:acetyl esterase/lipase